MRRSPTHFALASQAIAGHAALAFLALFVQSMYPKECPSFGTRAIVAAALAAAAMSVLPGLLPPQAAAAITIAGAAWLAWIVAKAALARPKPWPALLLGMPVLLPLLTLEMFRGFAPGG
jgi:hypothetical protein